MSRRRPPPRLDWGLDWHIVAQETKPKVRPGVPLEAAAEAAPEQKTLELEEGDKP